MVPVAIGLGSNVGNSVSHVLAAADQLCALMQSIRLSSLYRTSPMYVEEQQDFINAVAVGETSLAPRDLLAELKRLETEMGRTSGVRYGPRIIDLDLLSYGALHYCFDAPMALRLELPHPRIIERRFVLEPLNEVAADWNLPGMGRVQDLLKRSFEGQQVTRLDHANGRSTASVS